MFLHKGKEYYPLELESIKSHTGKDIYTKFARNRSYVYLAIENSDVKGAEKCQTM